MNTIQVNIKFPKPIKHRIIYKPNDDDILKDIKEAKGYKITNKGDIISYLGKIPYCLRHYKSKTGKNVVDLRIDGKYKSFHVQTLLDRYFPAPIPEGFVIIPRFNGAYYINKNGDILSNSCISKSNKGRRIMKPSVNNNGYLIVTLNRKTYYVHRLVAETFIPNINNLSEVNHINEIKTDNNVSNLEWCDSNYNVNYGTRTYRSSEKHKKAIKVINIITNCEKICDSYNSAAAYMKCNKGCIKYALQHNTIICNIYKVIQI